MEEFLFKPKIVYNTHQCPNCGRKTGWVSKGGGVICIICPWEIMVPLSYDKCKHDWMNDHIYSDYDEVGGEG